MKSKWQEKGVCPRCKWAEFIDVSANINIRTGKPTQMKAFPGKCWKCDTKFWWYPASGKITRAKK